MIPCIRGPPRECSPEEKVPRPLKKKKHNFNKITVDSVTLCDQQQSLYLLAGSVFHWVLERRNMIKGTTFINLINHQ